jgi:hypothetical protein
LAKYIEYKNNLAVILLEGIPTKVEQPVWFAISKLKIVFKYGKSTYIKYYSNNNS